MMKKIAILLTAALLLCALAAAETYVGERYTLTLPEGFAPVAEADMEGYLQAAARDAGAAYDGDEMLALGTDASISVMGASTVHANTQEAAEALIAEYADYVAGFEAVAHTVKLNRWAQAFQDLGNVDPRLALDLALALLPGLERGRTGIGQLLGVVTAQYARAQAEGWAPPLGEALVGWLGLFRGSSQAAKYARTLKEMDQ